MEFGFGIERKIEDAGYKDARCRILEFEILEFGLPKDSMKNDQ